MSVLSLLHIFSKLIAMINVKHREGIEVTKIIKLIIHNRVY